MIHRTLLTVLLTALTSLTVGGQSQAATQVSCHNADQSTKISILFRDSGSDQGMRAKALEISRHQVAGPTVVERFTTDDGALNNSDEFVVAYVSDRPAVAFELGFDDLLSIAIDIGSSVDTTRRGRAAQVVFTGNDRKQTVESFVCESIQ